MRSEREPNPRVLLGAVIGNTVKGESNNFGSLQIYFELQ